MQQPYNGIKIKARLIHRTNILTSLRKWYNWFLCRLSIKCKYDINASVSRCIDFHLFFDFKVRNIVRSYDWMIHYTNIYMLIIHCKLSYDTEYKLITCQCIICKMHSCICFFVFMLLISYDRTIRMIHSSTISIIGIYCKVSFDTVN